MATRIATETKQHHEPGSLVIQFSENFPHCMENEGLWAFETLETALYLNMADHPKTLHYTHHISSFTKCTIFTL